MPPRDGASRPPEPRDEALRALDESRSDDESADRAADLVREAFVTAIARNDALGAERAVLAAVEDGLPVRDVYLKVAQPALYEIGRGWERGELTVAQEHLATATVQSLIARLSVRLGASGKPRGRAIVACAPGELHAVGAHFVADFLEGDGWEVLMLGPSTPLLALADLVRVTRPAVVALSTTLGSNLPATAAVMTDLSSLDPRPLLVVGGAAFGGREILAREFGADVYAADAEALRDRLREAAPGATA